MTTAMTAIITEIKNEIGLGAESSSDMVLPFLVVPNMVVSLCCWEGTNLNGTGLRLRSALYAFGFKHTLASW